MARAFLNFAPGEGVPPKLARRFAAIVLRKFYMDFLDPKLRYKKLLQWKIPHLQIL